MSRRQSADDGEGRQPNHADQAVTERQHAQTRPYGQRRDGDAGNQDGLVLGPERIDRPLGDGRWRVVDDDVADRDDQRSAVDKTRDKF